MKKIVDLIENMLTEKLTYGIDAANSKKIFTQQPIDNINFYGKRSYNRICRTIQQKQIWLDVRRVE